MCAARAAEVSEETRVREARARYFDANGLSEEGYRQRWVWLYLGPLPLPLYNSGARARAVRLHDLHHVATGYATTWRGEAEIGAWEIAGGCGRHVPAWLLNSAAALVGLAIAPRRTLRAFRAGRHSRPLYRIRDGEFHERYLDLTVGELRALVGLAGEDPAYETLAEGDLAGRNETSPAS